MGKTKKYSNCDEVYKKLRVYLSSLSSECGDRVPSERIISEELEVNRTTLRIAIHRLVDEFVLERHVGVGTFFKVSSDEIEPNKKTQIDYSPIEVLEIRIMIEPQIAKIAARDIKEEDILALKKIFKITERKPNAHKIEESDVNFNEHLAELSKNSILRKMYQDIAQIRRYNLDEITSNKKEDNLLLFINNDHWLEHQDKLIFALERNQAEAAENAVKNKLQTLADII